MTMNEMHYQVSTLQIGIEGGIETRSALDTRAPARDLETRPIPAQPMSGGLLPCHQVFLPCHQVFLLPH